MQKLLGIMDCFALCLQAVTISYYGHSEAFFPSTCAQLPATMPTLYDLSPFDLGILGLLLVLCMRGLWLGCLRQLPLLVSLVGGYVLLGQVGHTLLPWISPFITSAKVSFLLAFGVFALFGTFFFTRLIKLAGWARQRISWRNRLLGLLVGGLTAAMLTTLVYMGFDSMLSTTNTLLRSSQTTPYLRQGAELLRSLIVDPQLRQAFQHKEPAIAPESPAGKEAIPRAESPSTKP